MSWMVVLSIPAQNSAIAPEDLSDRAEIWFVASASVVAIASRKARVISVEIILAQEEPLQ
jgi:hypothetical protein